MQLDIQSQYNSSVKGYYTGYQKGYRLGCCKTIRRLVLQDPLVYHDCKVLFIPQGLEAIDTGVIEGFRGLIRELIIGNAQEMQEIAQAYQPDLVLVMNGLHVFPDNHLDQINAIRAMGIKTAIWFADDPYYTDYTVKIAPSYDYVFTHEISCVSLYQSKGCQQVHYLPLAVRNTLYRPLEVSTKYMNDICFVGNAFPNRIEFFNSLVPYLANKKVMIVGAQWDRLKQYSLLAKQIHLEWIPIEETIKYYNGAKIVVNLHRGVQDRTYNRNSEGISGCSTNTRTFEINSCGVFQLTDVRDDLQSLYLAGVEIETYGSPLEFVHKADYYLSRDKERSQIAYRGFKRTLKDHTFRQRIHQLLMNTLVNQNQFHNSLKR